LKKKTLQNTIDEITISKANVQGINYYVWQKRSDPYVFMGLAL